MTTLTSSSTSTFTETDVVAAIAKVDRLRSACNKLVEKQNENWRLKTLRPIRPDMSLPRHGRDPYRPSFPGQSSSPSEPTQSFRSPRYAPKPQRSPAKPQSSPAKSRSPAVSSAARNSFDTWNIDSESAQQRFDRMRREGIGYRPLCSGSFGADVDRAFEECSNAPY
jgi:hypothetical protein